jgi:hypothetical protein
VRPTRRSDDHEKHLPFLHLLGVDDLRVFALPRVDAFSLVPEAARLSASRDSPTTAIAAAEDTCESYRY